MDARSRIALAWVDQAGCKGPQVLHRGSIKYDEGSVVLAKLLSNNCEERVGQNIFWENLLKNQLHPGLQSPDRRRRRRRRTGPIQLGAKCCLLLQRVGLLVRMP